jgi:hypothetical protein
MMCVCGHDEEDHKTKSGSCRHCDDGTIYSCMCAGYEKEEVFI